MSAIHETAYPRIKPKLTAKELETVFASTPDELTLLDANTKKTRLASRLGFMLTLKCYQYLGRVINVKHLDPAIITFVSQKLDIAQTINLDGYEQSAKKRHIKIIRDHLQMNADKIACRSLMKTAAITAANTKENLADIINCMIDELIKSRFELPAFQNFVRLARAARHFVNTSYFDKITTELSNDQKILIDSMMAVRSEDELSPELMIWSMLKREPQKPTTYKVRDYIRYVKQLKDLRKNINIDLDFIPPARIEQLRDEAIIADIDDMKSMRPTKRYALATILIYMKSTAAMDDLVQIFIAWVKKIEALAKRYLFSYPESDVI